MPEEILINHTNRETRVALLENGMLQELLIERASRRGLAGNIYMGRVSRVLPGMQAAFVDIGIARTAFLHASDIAWNGAAGDEPDGPPDIVSLLHEGQRLPVQVIKDPLGTKGARLTTRIAIPSRYLVLLPTEKRIGLSARIEDEQERERLRTLLEATLPDDPSAGFIVRTAAEGVGQDALEAEIRFLDRLWQTIREAAKRARPGQLIHEDLSLAVRAIRDMASLDVTRIQVDSETMADTLRTFAGKFMPEIVSRIEHYGGRRPILDLYGVEDEIEKALDRKVSMQSGGYVIFDQTEALTTIDVNTGGYVGNRNQEETIFRTNLEAAVTIARQLRIRNLGGIIIIDFIDMEDEQHRRQVLDAFEKALATDHARTKISEHSALGLVEMTRKRTRESLEHVMCDSCSTCQGSGFVKTPETVCYEIFREILRQHRQFSFERLVVLAHQEVVELLLDEESSALAELESLTGKPIRLQTEALFAPDRYDVVLM